MMQGLTFGADVSENTTYPLLDQCHLHPYLQVMIEFIILICTAIGALLAVHGIRLLRTGIDYGENRRGVFWGAAWVSFGAALFGVAYWILVTYAQI